MDRLKTEELEKILRKTHLEDFATYYSENRSEMIPEKDAFGSYIKEIIYNQKLTLQKVFERAEISDTYGYRLLLGERHTRERDAILRICYCANLSLEQTQSALKKYGMSPLYAKVPRDSLLMLIFNERPGKIGDVNKLLAQHKFAELKKITER